MLGLACTNIASLSSLICSITATVWWLQRQTQLHRQQVTSGNQNNLLWVTQRKTMWNIYIPVSVWPRTISRNWKKKKFTESYNRNNVVNSNFMLTRTNSSFLHFSHAITVIYSLGSNSNSCLPVVQFKKKYKKRSISLYKDPTNNEQTRKH